MPILFVRLWMEAYPLVVHHLKNITNMRIEQPSKAHMVKKKIEALKETLRRYESNAEYLGGYRIEISFTSQSLSDLVNRLNEGTFSLRYIENQIACARGLRVGGSTFLSTIGNQSEYQFKISLST